MKEILKPKIKETLINAGLTGILAITAAAGYLFVRSDNYLSEAKASNANPPSADRVCDPYEGSLNPIDVLKAYNGLQIMDCYTPVTQELCDGQYTPFDLEDDVCETLTYWNYVAPVSRP